MYSLLYRVKAPLQTFKVENDEREEGSARSERRRHALCTANVTDDWTLGGTTPQPSWTWLLNRRDPVLSMSCLLEVCHQNTKHTLTIVFTPLPRHLHGLRQRGQGGSSGGSCRGGAGGLAPRQPAHPVLAQGGARGACGEGRAPRSARARACTAHVT